MILHSPAGCFINMLLYQRYIITIAGSFGMPVLFTLHLPGLLASCIFYFCIAAHLPSYCKFAHFVFAYLLCCSLLSCYLGPQCLAYLPKFDHFFALQRIHIFCLFVCYVLLVHFRVILLFFVATNSSFLSLRNNILNMLIGIIFPSQPVSIF